VKRDDKRKKTDEQLMKESIRGDKPAFTELVRRYEDLVYRFSFKVCRNEHEAQEALQDTFINVYRSLKSFDSKSKLSTWLYRIVTNNCLMKRRRTKMQESLESLDNPPVGEDGRFVEPIVKWEETPADLLMKKEFRSILNNAIDELPPDYRAVFVLRDVEGQSTEEAAKVLNISREATKSRLRRARAFLRQELSPYIASPSGVA
jgi:RNA polymerase sigma-70 factor (ECF subfamily)